MKKNGFVFGLLATVLVFGLALTGCDSGSGGGGSGGGSSHDSALVGVWYQDRTSTGSTGFGYVEFKSNGDLLYLSSTFGDSGKIATWSTSNNILTLQSDFQSVHRTETATYTVMGPALGITGGSNNFSNYYMWEGTYTKQVDGSN